MDILCFSTNLSSSDWASWVQAIGSILAIFGAGAVAVWQSRAQHTSALAIQKEQQKQASLELGKTLLILCQNCSKAAAHFRSLMKDRDSISKVVSGETYFDFGELDNLVHATSSIPLYSLPHSLVTHAMVLGATLRQLRQTVDMAVRLYRSMDAQSFSNLFITLNEMCDTLILTSKDIEKAVASLEQK